MEISKSEKKGLVYYSPPIFHLGGDNYPTLNVLAYCR